MRDLKSLMIIILAIPLLLSGCEGKLPDIDNNLLSDSYREDAKVYRTIYSGEVFDLNYLRTSAAVDTAVCSNVIDTLVDYDNKGNIIPGLAESWEPNGDMTEWTFHLRDDITWVDYEGNYYADVTADDWVCGAEYVNDASNNADCQYMYSTGSVVKNAEAYYEYTTYLSNPSGYDTPPEKVDPSEIGVQAKDDRTLVYILEKPCPFFPSVLCYTSYLPVCRKYLQKTGSMFATNYKNILYNGAYILHFFEPLEKRILVKNPFYWDKDQVYIDRVESYYDQDANMVGAERFMAGSTDKATIPLEKLDEYLKDPEMKENIHNSLPEKQYSYFYSFNYVPNFDEKYEPDNWKKAVVNMNFRKAIGASIDRLRVLSVFDPNNPEMLINNTITPEGTSVNDGKDYTEFGKLKILSETDSFDPSAAAEYRDKAKEELAAEGVTFPVKILMPYNPATSGWEEEVNLVKEQLEGTLGKDFVEVYIEEGSPTGFLKSVRRSGKYALMKCNWGADYADPQTWSEPFSEDCQYTFWNESEDEEIQKLFKEWEGLVTKAASITNDDYARYLAFSEAEALIIENSVVIPFSILNEGGYKMDKLDPFEGEYATYGMAPQRYKGHHLMDHSMNLEEFNKGYEEWLKR